MDHVEMVQEQDNMNAAV